MAEISLEEFNLLVLRYIQKKYPHSKSSLRDDLGITANIGEGEHTLYLHNIYERALKNNLSGWEFEIDQLLHPPSTDLSDWNKVKDKIFPQIKTRGWVITSNSRVPDLSQQIIASPLTDDLGACWAVETPEQLVYIQTKYLKDWGKSLQEVTAQGFTNLIKLSSKKTPKIKDLGNEKIMIYSQDKDYFDSARVLLLIYESNYNNYAKYLGENFIVGVPDRDLFVAFPANIPMNIEGYVEEEFKRGQHPIITHLYFATRKGLIPVKKQHRNS